MIDNQETAMDRVNLVAILLGYVALQATADALGQERPSGARMVLLDFDAAAPPLNAAGDGYPTYYDARQGARGEGGLFKADVNIASAVRGGALHMSLSVGALYAQFNPYDKHGNRGFAREYCADAAAWKFNTYNRLRFWIRLPDGATPHCTDGRSNLNVGTYVKRIKNPDPRSDEAGGDHYYHLINVPALGCWTQVVLNMHPDHRRGNGGNEDPGDLTHPTGEADYNYFDTLTRFYIQDERPPARHPASILLDEFEFYEETAKENDERVYSLTATYVPQSNRLLVNWRRRKSDNDVRHEVRYAWEDIHKIGWKRARAAPQGVIRPPGWGGYNGMVYDSLALPLRGRGEVYIAIKPENSDLFSQIVVPLGLK
jgi:hypothetical protein